MIVLEAIHDAKPLIEVAEHRNAADPFAHILVTRRNLHHQLVERFRENVVEDIEFLHFSGLPLRAVPRRHLNLNDWPCAFAMGYASRPHKEKPRMIIDIHAHVTAPQELYAYKAEESSPTVALMAEALSKCRTHF